jgi:hypothetical protein
MDGQRRGLSANYWRLVCPRYSVPWVDWCWTYEKNTARWMKCMFSYDYTVVCGIMTHAAVEHCWTEHFANFSPVDLKSSLYNVTKQLHFVFNDCVCITYFAECLAGAIERSVAIPLVFFQSAFLGCKDRVDSHFLIYLVLRMKLIVSCECCFHIA